MTYLMMLDVQQIISTLLVLVGSLLPLFPQNDIFGGTEMERVNPLIFCV